MWFEDGEIEDGETSGLRWQICTRRGRYYPRLDKQEIGCFATPEEARRRIYEVIAGKIVSSTRRSVSDVIRRQIAKRNQRRGKCRR